MPSREQVDVIVTAAWNMRGRLLDLRPGQLDLVADHIARIPLKKRPVWLVEAQAQIDRERGQ